MDKLQTIREACIKANPEIGRGCSVCHGEGYTSQYHSYPCTKCKGTGKEESRPIRLSDILLAIENREKCHCNGDWQNKFNVVHRGDCKFDTGGIKVYLHYSFSEIVIQWGRTEIRWNLRNDDLSQQSSECIEFLHELLQ